MECGSRAGKTEQHSRGKAQINEARCRGCMICLKDCANDGLWFDGEAKKMRVNVENCMGCGRCPAAGSTRTCTGGASWTCMTISAIHGRNPNGKSAWARGSTS